MQHIIKVFIVFVCFALFSCQEEKARAPIAHSGGAYLKTSIQKNKELTVSEEKAIQNYIKNDSLHKYYQSKSGFWYKYIKANITDTLTPQPGMITEIDFDIKDIHNQPIYTKEETTPKIYIVDRQEIMVGLRHAIKLMRKGETITFLFPSHMGYGFLGDKERIGQHEPIVCEVTLKDIKKE